MEKDINGAKEQLVHSLRELEGKNYVLQLTVLQGFGFLPEQVSGTSSYVIFESNNNFQVQGRILVVKGKGILFFNEDPVVQDIYPIITPRGGYVGFGIKRNNKFEMYLVDSVTFATTSICRVSNGLSVDGSFGSHDDLVAFIQFYFSHAFNDIEI